MNEKVNKGEYANVFDAYLKLRECDDLIASNEEAIKTFMNDRSKNHMMEMKSYLLERTGRHEGCYSDATINFDYIFINDFMTALDIKSIGNPAIKHFMDCLKDEGRIEWYCEDRHRTEDFYYFSETYPQEIIQKVIKSFGSEFTDLNIGFQVIKAGSPQEESKGLSYVYYAYKTNERVYINSSFYELLEEALSTAVRLHFIYNNVASVTFDW